MKPEVTIATGLGPAKNSIKEATSVAFIYVSGGTCIALMLLSSRVLLTSVPICSPYKRTPQSLELFQG